MKRNLYLFKHGRLRRRGNTLYLEAGSGTDGEGDQILPIESIEALYLFGELELNTKLLNFLAYKGIPMHIFNYYGYYSGSFMPRDRRPSGFLLIRQARAYWDEGERRYLAAEIVGGSLHHILRTLRDYRHRGKPVEPYIAEIEQERARIPAARGIPELMGIEGRARERYYQAWGEILNWDISGFKRIRRPPDSPLNALISFANGVLYAAVLQELYHTALHPAISFLHEPGERRYSLALDLADIFKALIVDPTIFRLINRRELTEADFAAEGQGVFLSEAGRKKVLRALEETFRRTVQHRQLRRKVSYRRLLRLEGYKLVRHLVGDEDYRAFRAWW